MFAKIFNIFRKNRTEVSKDGSIHWINAKCPCCTNFSIFPCGALKNVSKESILECLCGICRNKVAIKRYYRNNIWYVQVRKSLD